MLILSLIVSLADVVALTALALGIALIFYALCWYNFARLASAIGVLPLWQGLIIAVVGFASLFLAIPEIKVIAATGWILVGLSMLAVARTIKQTHLLPDGFAAGSGGSGILVILIGIFSGTGNDAAGPIVILFGWALMMSVMYIGWGHPEERETGLKPMKLQSRD